MIIQPTKQQLESNIRKLYWINALNSTQFHLVVYTLFILAKGFNMSQFFLIESAYMIINLLTEIPTGALSDRISRKLSLILGAVVMIPITFAIIVSNNFWVVLIAMGIGGLGASFVSGTDSAILYDTLKGLKQEKEYKRVRGKLKWFGAWAGSIGGIVGGILANYSLSYPWWAWFIVGFPVLFITLTLIEPPISRKSVIDETHSFHLKESLKYSFTRESGFFVLYSAVILFFFSLSFWLWQPYLKLTGLPLFYFGIFYAVENLVSGYVSKQAHKIESKIGIQESLFIAPFILVICFFLQSQIVFIFGFLFIFLHSISGGYLYPVLDDYVNKRIPSKRRATVLSMKNMLSSLLFAILAPIAGYAIDKNSLQPVFFIIGILLVISTIIFYIRFRKHRKP
jgi:MFS family permease